MSSPSLFQLDAVLGAAKLQRATVELGGVVHVQHLGKSGHRPIDMQIEMGEPVALRQHDAADQQRDSCRVEALHAEEQADDAARGEVDGNRQPRLTHVKTGESVDDEDISLGVVDLYDLERTGGAEAARCNLGTGIVGQSRQLGAAMGRQASAYRVARGWGDSELAATAPYLRVRVQYRACELTLPG